MSHPSPGRDWIKGEEMIATSHERQSWKDNPKAKDDCGDGLVTVDRRLDRGARLLASIYAVRLACTRAEGEGEMKEAAN